MIHDKKYLPQFKFYVSCFSTSTFGIELMRFDGDNYNRQIQTDPHIALEVDDLDFE